MSRVKASWPSPRWTSPPLLPVPMPSRAIRTPVLPSGTMSVARAGDAAMAAGALSAAPMTAADWRMNSRRFRRCSLIRPPVMAGSLYGPERLLRDRSLRPRPSVRRDQARHGGNHDRAKDDPDEAEGRDATQQADEHQQPVHLRATRQQRRAHHVVYGADHAGPQGDEDDPLGGGAVHEEPDAGGQPDRPRADRQQGEEGHGHAPEHRRADADRPEQQAARRALRAGDSNRGDYARPYQIVRLADDVLALLILEREHPPDQPHDPARIPEEEEHREDHDDQIEQQDTEIAQQVASPRGGEAAELPTQVSGDLRERDAGHEGRAMLQPCPPAPNALELARGDRRLHAARRSTRLTHKRTEHEHHRHDEHRRDDEGAQEGCGALPVPPFQARVYGVEADHQDGRRAQRHDERLGDDVEQVRQERERRIEGRRADAIAVLQADGGHRRAWFF